MALVRIKPYNPRIGHKLRTFNDLGRKIKLRGDRHWHTFNDPTKVKFLRVACQNGKTLDENTALGIVSPLAFDVAKNKDAAQRIVDNLTASTGRHAKKIVGTIDAPVTTEERPGRKPARKKTPAELAKAAKRAARLAELEAELDAEEDDDADADDGDDDENTVPTIALEPSDPDGSEDGGSEDDGSEDDGSEDGGSEDGGSEDGGSEDGGPELSVEELFKARTSRIEELTARGQKPLRVMAKAAELKVPRGSNATDIAVLLVDHEEAEKAFG